MTTRQDTWSTLATPPWVKVLTAGDVSTDGRLLSSSAAGNYIIYAVDTLSNTAMTAANPAVVTLPEPHAYSIGETFPVAISGATGVGGLLANGHWIATATAADAYSIPVNTAAGVTQFGTTYFNKKTSTLPGTQQDVATLALSTAEGASHSITIWARAKFHGNKTGYGLRLTWAVGGTRTSELLKIHPGTGAKIVLSSTTALTTYKDSAGSDLSGLQKLRLIVTDDASLGGEGVAVRVRGYINTDNLSGPTLDYLDRGHLGTPPHTGNGLWVIEFDVATDVKSASFEATDDYLEIAPGITPVSRRRTLAQLRAMLKLDLARGPVDNFDDDLCNQRLNEGLEEIEDHFGSKAIWRDRTETMTLVPVGANSIITMPYEVEYVESVARAVDGAIIGHALIGVSHEDNLIISLADMGSASSYIVRFLVRRARMAADDDVCPVPMQWDELVRLAALVRMVNARRDPEYAATQMTMLEKRKREVMSNINRTYVRMQRPQLVPTEPPVTWGPAGTLWQPDWPF